MPEGALGALCMRAGLQHLEKNQALAALAVYKERKQLQLDFINGTFIPWRRDKKDKIPQHEAGGGGGQQDVKDTMQTNTGMAAFHELVARLAAAKVENETLRQILVPTLGEDTLNKLMGEHMPYSWMTILLAGLKSYSNKAPSWATEELAQPIWTVVNEELRARRQGRLSGQQPSPQGQMVGQPAGQTQYGCGQPRMANRPPGNCFQCGQRGHRAATCPVAGRKGGRVQFVGQQQLWVSAKGVAFDMQGPPPAPCRYCGGSHRGQNYPMNPENQQQTPQLLGPPQGGGG